jgi:hypothetical protein
MSCGFRWRVNALDPGIKIWRGDNESERVVADRLVSELIPNFERETVKSTSRRLTMAPIPDEMNFTEVIRMKMMKEKH